MSTEKDEQKPDGQAAVASSDGFGGWLRTMLGTRVWTEDFDGEVRKSKMRRCRDGTLIVRGIYGWWRAEKDGSFPVNARGYMRRWWLQ